MLSWLLSGPLPVGVPAPPFTCLDEEGNEFELARHRGSKIVLVFYPGDNTPICQRQMCDLRDNWNKLRSCGAIVFGINPAGQESHQSFRSNNQLPFPLLIDPYQRIAVRYNANGLVVKRTVYVINEAGIIIYAKRGRPPIAEIVAAML